MFGASSTLDLGIVVSMVTGIIAVFIGALAYITKMMWKDNKARLDSQELRHSKELDRMANAHNDEMSRFDSFRSKKPC